MKKNNNFWSLEDSSNDISRSLDPFFSMFSILNICERWARFSDENEDR